MLPQAHRLTKKTDFSRLALEGHSFYSSLLTIKILKNKEQESRFGVIISAKVSKKATVRNKIKRRITEIIRLALLQLESGFDVMILVKPAVVKKSYQEIKEEIEKLFKKAKIFK